MIARLLICGCVVVFAAGCSSLVGSSEPPGQDDGPVIRELGGAEDADPLAAEIDLSNQAAADETEEPVWVD